LILAWKVDARFDGAGSVVVGLVLVGVSVFLARKVKSLLLGERADPDLEKSVRAAAVEDPRIVEVLNLITVQQGPDEVLLAAKIRVHDELPAGDAARVIDEFEQRVRAREPEVRWQFVEIDSD
jgi:divalent metal cation (Fe/Co/Zn/Cd) transporter